MSRGDLERQHRPINAKLYIGNLGEYPPRKEDLEYEFGYFGKLINVWIARSPPGFAYIEFESEKDARDAQKALDGKTVNDRRIKVEHARKPNSKNLGKNSFGSNRARRSRSRDRYGNRIEMTGPKHLNHQSDSGLRGRNGDSGSRAGGSRQERRRSRSKSRSRSRSQSREKYRRSRSRS